MPSTPLARTFLFLFFCATASASSAAVGLWAQLYSSDLKQFASQLRDGGVPEETVGLLVSQEVNARFREREQKLQPSFSSVQALREGWTAERREALLQLKQEKNDLLRSVFGALPEETANPVRIPETLAHLSKSQRELVRLIVEDYQVMNARVVTESRGVLLEEDREKLSYLEAARDADLVKVLGEENATDYQIGMDRLMQATIRRLQLFHPAPAELRDLFLLRRKHGYALAIQNTSNPGEQLEARKKVNADLLERWGPERFAAYLRFGSPIYQPIFFLVQRLGHPPAVADQIYDSQVAAREGPVKMLEEIRARGPIRVERGERPPLPGDLAKKLIAEHCALVKQLLGEAGYNEYYRLTSRIIDTMNEGHTIKIDDTI